MCAITTLPTLILFATEGSAFKFVFEIENYFLTDIYCTAITVAFLCPSVSL